MVNKRSSQLESSISIYLSILTMHFLSFSLHVSTQFHYVFIIMLKSSHFFLKSYAMLLYHPHQNSSLLTYYYWVVKDLRMINYALLIRILLVQRFQKYYHICSLILENLSLLRSSLVAISRFQYFTCLNLIKKSQKNK